MVHLVNTDYCTHVTSDHRILKLCALVVSYFTQESDGLLRHRGVRSSRMLMWSCAYINTSLAVLAAAHPAAQQEQEGDDQRSDAADNGCDALNRQFAGHFEGAP